LLSLCWHEIIEGYREAGSQRGGLKMAQVLERDLDAAVVEQLRERAADTGGHYAAYLCWVADLL
jgi:hypothetical protein